MPFSYNRLIERRNTDSEIYSGPGPQDVARQYSDVVGKPAMMPYWGLGFHQCRYGMQDVYEVAEVVANYSAANIPLETMWTDIDYMNARKVFTLDPERYPLNKVRELVGTLHTRQQHYVMMVDPAVAYQDYPAFNNGVEQGIFMEYANGSIYKGVVWPGVTAFPDWFNPNTQGYWNSEFDTFFSATNGVDIDVSIFSKHVIPLSESPEELGTFASTIHSEQRTT